MWATQGHLGGPLDVDCMCLFGDLELAKEYAIERIEEGDSVAEDIIEVTVTRRWKVSKPEIVMEEVEPS
jgi:hypothetical protein